MSEWQPIETAPRDETQLLGWVPSYYQGRGGHAIIMWQDGCWWCPSAFKVNPSYWQPLPNGPQSPAPQSPQE